MAPKFKGAIPTKNECEVVIVAPTVQRRLEETLPPLIIRDAVVKAEARWRHVHLSAHGVGWWQEAGFDLEDV